MIVLQPLLAIFHTPSKDLKTPIHSVISTIIIKIITSRAVSHQLKLWYVKNGMCRRYNDETSWVVGYDGRSISMHLMVKNEQIKRNELRIRSFVLMCAEKTLKTEAAKLLDLFLASCPCFFSLDWCQAVFINTHIISCCIWIGSSVDDVVGFGKMISGNHGDETLETADVERVTM